MKISTPLLMLFVTVSAQAQIQIVPTATNTNEVALSGTYTQNFDSLAGTGFGRPWIDNATLPGWYVTDTSYGFGFGVAEGVYSMGYTGGQGDRALGAVGNSSLGHLFAVSFKNLTASTLTSVSVTFDGEQWNRTAANPQKTSTLFFSYQIYEAGSGVIYRDEHIGWTFVSALDFTSPNATLNAGSMLDGNDPQNSIRGINATINGLALSPGQELWLSWGSSGPSPIHGLGIDNLSVSFATTIPEPAAFAGLVGLGALGFALSRRRSRLG